MTACFGLLVLLSACRSDPDAAEPVPIVVEPGEIHVPTRTLDYGTVPLHETVQLDLVLSNVGTGTLYIHDLQLSDDRLRVHWQIVGDIEQQIPPGQTVLVPVSLSPRDVLDPSVVLTILSSDPATPRATVELTGQVRGVPVLRLDPNVVEFGEVSVGQEKTLDVLLSNLGNDTLVLESVTLDTEDRFVLIIDPSGMTLAAGQGNGLASVTYTPENTGNHTGLLTFISDDPARPEIVVPVTGSGG